MSELTTVLFDLDGTLIDTIDDLAWTAEQILTKWGRGNADGSPVHTREEYHQFVGNGIRVLVQRAFGDTLSDAELDTATAEFLELYNTHLDVHTAPYAGILPLLDALKARGIRMGVVTNKPETQARYLANKFFAEYGFLCVYGSVTDRPNKPHPQVVELALADCGTNAEHTVFVGDSDVDVQTAHNAGLYCYGAAWGFRGAAELHAAGAEAVPDTPLDLRDMLALC